MQMDRRQVLFSAGGAALGVTLGLTRDAVAQPATSSTDAPLPPGAFPRPPGFARVIIGDIEGMVLSDGSYRFPQFQPLFVPEGPPEELRAVMEAGFAAPEFVPSEVNTLLLRIEGRLVLIDTGFGEFENVPGGRLMKSLGEAGVSPSSIDAVIITHAHRDHVWGLARPDDSPAFPNARVYMSRREYEFWASGDPDLTSMRVPEEWKALWKQRTPKVLAAVQQRLELFSPGDRPFGGRIEFLDTSGHTVGHISPLVHGGNESLLVTSDLVHNHVFSLARPRWTTGFDWDTRRCVDARLRMLDRAAADRLRVLAYHLPWPGLGYIVRDGVERFRWHQDRWQW